MKTPKKPYVYARALGALITIVTVDAIVVISLLEPSIEPPTNLIYVLLGLIGSLLGLDVLLDRLPIQVGIETNTEEED